MKDNVLCKVDPHTLECSNVDDAHGTEWCEAGEGATARKLAHTIYKAVDACWLPYNSGPKATRAVDHLMQMLTRKGTNLKLTGRPLTSTDLERIARCEVK